MSKKKRKSPPFVMLPKKMIRSKAWQDLSCHARAAYIEIKAKYNGNNEDNLSYTYEEAGKIMHRNTYAKVIKELLSHGFIDIPRPGGLFHKCNIFALSEKWEWYGTAKFVPGVRNVANAFNPKW